MSIEFDDFALPEPPGGGDFPMGALDQAGIE